MSDSDVEAAVCSLIPEQTTSFIKELSENLDIGVARKMVCCCGKSAFGSLLKVSSICLSPTL